MVSPKLLLSSHHLHAKKKWGQSFLNDKNAAEMIIRNAEISDKDIVLEIGAGLGALTIPAAKAAQKIIAVDKDHNLINLLDSQLKNHQAANVELLLQDVLTLNLETLYRKSEKQLLVIGNLPYYISSQILVWLIENRQFVKRAVLMFQKELGERLMAHPGSKDYGRISVMLQYCSDIRPIAAVKASQFFPKPQVDSVVLEIRFKISPYPVSDEGFLFRVIKAGFGNRRKTLKNALAGSDFHLDGRLAEEALISAGIDPMRRAETLSVAEFVKLSEQIKPRIPYKQGINAISDSETTLSDHAEDG